jgi:3' terminal RNA ribose 2'-O-methyltransferase Hen1
MIIAVRARRQSHLAAGARRPDNRYVLLTITTTRAPATDLGYLLFKHPGKVQSWPVASGQAHVFYPEAAQDRCTAALLLTVPALARLAEADDLAPEELDNAVPGEGEGDEGPKPVPLAVQRREAVLAVLRESGARAVGDLGCGDGALTKHLISEKGIDRVIAADVSARALAIAARRLRLERLSEAKRASITLIQSALTYRDERLTNLDAAVLMEVIEHVDDERLPALERAVFGFAAPSSVIVTTPNAEHNAVYGMTPGALRHPDHRWEWTRAQFRRWAGQVAATYGYSVRFAGAGPEAPEAGQPTQLAVFTKQAAA